MKLIKTCGSIHKPILTFHHPLGSLKKPHNKVISSHTRDKLIYFFGGRLVLLGSGKSVSNLVIPLSLPIARNSAISKSSTCYL
jgi:hypothetical protein